MRNFNLPENDFSVINVVSILLSCGLPESPSRKGKVSCVELGRRLMRHMRILFEPYAERFMVQAKGYAS